MGCAIGHLVGIDWLVFCLVSKTEYGRCMIAVSVAYVATDGQLLYQELMVKKGATIKQVIEQSGLLDGLSELMAVKEWLNHTPIQELPNHKCWYVGIFSQKKSLGEIVQAKDRIEIYRPLQCDPKNARQNKVRADTKKLARLQSAPSFRRK